MYRSKQEQECRKTKNNSFYPSKNIKNDEFDNKIYLKTKIKDKKNNFDTFRVVSSKSHISSLNITNYKKTNCNVDSVVRKNKNIK